MAVLLDSGMSVHHVAVALAVRYLSEAEAPPMTGRITWHM